MIRKAICRNDAGFEEAFNAARKEKADVFEWRGREYTTQLDTEVTKVEAKPIVTKIVILP